VPRSGAALMWWRPGWDNADPSITLRVYAHVIGEQLA
jgi:hypothetical protein